MNILVTGAAGFIASHLCSSLLEQGHHVTGIDNFDPFYDPSIKRNNIDNLTKHDSFHFVEGDIVNLDLLNEIMGSNKVDTVIHLAAKAGVRPSLNNPLEYVEANIKGTVSLMESMRQNNVQDIVIASSSSVYGTCKNIPFNEEAAFDHSISIYATSKQSTELFSKMYSNLYGLNCINLRFFTVYGPGQRPDLAIHKFLKSTLLDEEITLFGDGSMARDYTYIADIVGGIEGAINRVKNNQVGHEVFNLGNNSPVTLKELIETIEKVTGKKCKLNYKEVPPGDVPITYADISKSTELLGYNPKTSLEEGLGNFYQWIKQVYQPS